MTQVLYNLRTSDDQWRITKFTDGEVESSYLTSPEACDCPAGHRSTCRHRQMLPQMLARHLANSDLFWDYELGYSCDINGNAKRETVACAPAEQDTERRTFTIPDDHMAERDADGRATGKVVPAGPHVEEDTERRTRLLNACTKFVEDLAQPMLHPNMFIDPHAVPAGQHTAAEGLPPEQTIYDVMTGITTSLPKATWRRL